MASRTYLLAQDVRGAIKRLSASKARDSEFSADGQPLSRLEAIDALMDELAQGRYTIPLDNACGNPCQRNAQCPGFNYGKGGGGPGHPTEKKEQ